MYGDFNSEETEKVKKITLFFKKLFFVIDHIRCPFSAILGKKVDIIGKICTVQV